MTLEEKELEIIVHYQPRPQIKYMYTELSELQEAIIEYEHNIRQEKLDHIKEEIADVQLMLNQFKRYYDVSDEDIKRVMNEKADRQLKRIEEGK